MDEIMIIVLLAALPFYSISVVTVAYLASFAYHKAKTLGDSAQEQQITEQIPTK